MERSLIALLTGIWLLGTADAVKSANPSHRMRLALYKNVQAADIVWGREDDDDRLVGRIDPPYFTPDPYGVEVLVLVRYTNRTWQRSRNLTRVWRESLPDEVNVTWVPMGKELAMKHNLANQWLIHRNVYYAAEVLGLGVKAHQVLARLIGRNEFALRGTRGIEVFATELGIDTREFTRRLASPDVGARVVQASDFNFNRIRANTLRGASSMQISLHPVFIVNGKYSVSADFVGNPGKTYRIANGLIRRELRLDRSLDGPTNDEEFTEWMGPRDGEVFRRRSFGRTLNFDGVYNHQRRELWKLGADGDVKRAYRLVGEGDEAYFATSDSEASVRYVHVWRRARQYVSYKGEDGPQRYGAFLLTDHLTSPETLWVGLPFMGRDVALAFGRDGRVEARNDKGSLFGSWWLEAGNLNVSFGELGVQAWTWQDVAKHIGFEVPQVSIAPWLSGSGEKGSDSGGEGRR